MPNLQVKMSRGLKIVADCSIEDCAGKEWDAIVCPGGMPGAEHLRDSPALIELLKEQSKRSKVTAAMCASPAVVFSTHGLLPETATCYPNPKFKAMVPGWQEAQVVVDGHIITSQAAQAYLVAAGPVMFFVWLHAFIRSATAVCFSFYSQFQ
ncbi:unnamed protein product [Polarella glacialis]|uniref:DJ-1/PfpI domain-containing protein n=1 Tax=Polarella glacialis TaxID=89957 RepID=A0A813HHP7_POLGL|nr:unnamed protein product [Polarella glacialis]